MENWKKICALSAVVLCFSLCGLMLYLVLQKNQTYEEEADETGMAEEDVLLADLDRQEAAAARLKGFAEVLYTYDTAERMYYEGAEEYMTDEAYKEFVPFRDPEEETEMPIHMRSELLETQSFFHFTTEGSADVLMESRFTLTDGGRGFLIQYLKLTLESENGDWFITSVRVLDTIEQ